MAEPEPRVGGGAKFVESILRNIGMLHSEAAAEELAEVTDPEVLHRMYHRVIVALKQHQMAAPFRKPLDWQSIGLTNYPEVIKNPMDLTTVANKLERGEYASESAVLADVELIWSNAILFNGENSWIIKNINVLKPMAEKKFASARASLAKQLSATAGGGTADGGGFGARGGVGVVTVGNFAITPGMRLQLYRNAAELQPGQRLELKRLAMRHCPDAVTDVPNVQDPRSKDTKIDVDALDFSAFVRIDAWVRKLIASNPVG